MLYGRAAEVAVVEGLIEDARASRSSVLVIRGEAGVGKTALLGHAVASADGVRVLRCQGVEAESELALAAVYDLVRPVLDFLGELPEPQADALRGALGLAASPGNDRFLIGVGLLSLLAEAADERPLLCVIDDAHWLDQPSTDALTFVARRLDADGVAMLFAARDGEGSEFEAIGLPELRLDGLNGEAVSSLLHAHIRVARDVRDSLVERTGGNPLAVLESVALLTSDQLAGRDALPDPLLVGAGVERRFSERARQLPAGAQTLLLVAAAEDTGELAVLERAARLLDLDMVELAPAEVAGLVRVNERQVTFRHPLIRSAIYGAAPFAQRREVHEALAMALADNEHADRRAWHRAAARAAPDAEVADELERTADVARQRGGPPGSRAIRGG